MALEVKVSKSQVLPQGQGPADPSSLEGWFCSLTYCNKCLRLFFSLKKEGKLAYGLLTISSVGGPNAFELSFQEHAE